MLSPVSDFACMIWIVPDGKVNVKRQHQLHAAGICSSGTRKYASSEKPSQQQNGRLCWYADRFWHDMHTSTVSGRAGELLNCQAACENLPGQFSTLHLAN